MRRGELSFGDEIELRMIMADYYMKDECVFEQHEHLYTLNSADSRSLQHFSADFSSKSFLRVLLTLCFNLISLKYFLRFKIYKKYKSEAYVYFIKNNL